MPTSATRRAETAAKGHDFGSAPVFLAAISTILGAILFLRFGYAVANVGLLGAIGVILIGHMITIPTAMAISEIATDLKVGGGGEYFVVSRSFGSLLGGTIGISLYFSQAISTAFYMIAFSQAFTPLFGWIARVANITPDARMVSIPATLILLAIVFTKGARVGINALWFVVGILAVSLGLFFLGKPLPDAAPAGVFGTVEERVPFFSVFAIVFPAFTGMTAGVGLSGDLKNPRRAIPLGTLAATLVGMVVYLLVILKLAYSASPGALAGNQLVMSQIALWGPIVPIGLAAATLSSAIGSVLVAPRTMQALARDKIFPSTGANRFLSAGHRKANEPIHATLITAIIVLFFVAIGSVDFIARIISMFFMITYGTLCAVSFLEHLAANPSYRPTFRSRWYVSLIGAVACFVVMFKMHAGYAALAIALIVLIYMSLRRRKREETGLAEVFKGVLFQMIRTLQVLIQKRRANIVGKSWRPAFIAISSSSLTRLAPYDLLRWISYQYGFGCFFHFIRGNLSQQSAAQARVTLKGLVEQGVKSESGIYADTIISPSFKTAVAQIVQAPSVFGIENNSILFEFHRGDTEEIPDIIEGCRFAAAIGFSICVLRSSERHFGYRKKIHIWLTPGDYRNANLMILMAYILIGHPDWKGSTIEIFAAFEKESMDKEIAELTKLIASARIPISPERVQKKPFTQSLDAFQSLVCEHSKGADLVITGFSVNKLAQDHGKFFKIFESIDDILFVRAGRRIVIADQAQ